MTAVEQLIDIPPLHLDLKAGRLWNGELRIELRPKPWELIRYMARKPGELLSKQELMDAVWPHSFVSESSLNQVIKELRKALGDDARSPRFIETVHRRGFRLLTSEDRIASAAEGDQADGEQEGWQHHRVDPVHANAHARLAELGIGQVVQIVGAAVFEQ